MKIFKAPGAVGTGQIKNRHEKRYVTKTLNMPTRTFLSDVRYPVLTDPRHFHVNSIDAITDPLGPRYKVSSTVSPLSACSGCRNLEVCITKVVSSHKDAVRYQYAQFA